MPSALLGDLRVLTRCSPATLATPLAAASTASALAVAASAAAAEAFAPSAAAAAPLAALAAACAVMSNAASWRPPPSRISSRRYRGATTPRGGHKGGEAGAVATAPGESFITFNDFRVASA